MGSAAPRSRRSWRITTLSQPLSESTAPGTLVRYYRLDAIEQPRSRRCRTGNLVTPPPV
jgi:hypothetical protein